VNTLQCFNVVYCCRTIKSSCDARHTISGGFHLPWKGTNWERSWTTHAFLRLRFRNCTGRSSLIIAIPSELDEELQQKLLSELMTGPIRTVRCKGFVPYEVTEGAEYLVAIRNFYEGKIKAKKPDTIDDRFWSMIEGSLEKVFDAKRIDLAIDFKEISN
jgi:hypothetical protein